MEYAEDARRDGGVRAKEEGDYGNGYGRGSWGTAGSEGDWMRRLLGRIRQEIEGLYREFKGLEEGGRTETIEKPGEGRWQGHGAWGGEMGEAWGGP
jgi:hypothetical protein